ncbi:MAG: hypothetical protein R2822_09315 [Spirosomataceae bacterium]
MPLRPAPNLDQKLIGFNLLPETFTMKELQALYEAVYNREFAMNNFQKRKCWT